MEKLDTPVSVDTQFGPVQATHIAHNYSVQEIGDRRIISTRQYCVLVGKELRAVGQVSTIEFIGEERDAFGDDPTGVQILAKHLEVADAQQHAQAVALETRRTALEREIAETQQRLETLKSQTV